MKKDVKKTILEAAAPLIHAQGFHRTGLKEILDAAGVPKGSFYFYFKSKEDFGLALIDYYVEGMQARSGPMLQDEGVPPLARLSGFFEFMRGRMEQDGFARGCPIGNLAQEVSDLSPPMREKLSQVMAGFSRVVEAQLAEAAVRGELAEGVDPAQAAGFIVDAWEGAILRAKTDKDPRVLKRFHDFVFHRLLA